MAWVKSGPPPRVIKVSFEVDQEKYPDLHAWIDQLPPRKLSATIRDALNQTVKVPERKLPRDNEALPNAAPHSSDTHAALPGALETPASEQRPDFGVSKVDQENANAQQRIPAARKQDDDPVSQGQMGPDDVRLMADFDKAF